MTNLHVPRRCHALDFFDGKKRVAAPEIFTENPRLPERPKSAPYGKPVSDAPFFPAFAVF